MYTVLQVQLQSDRASLGEGWRRFYSLQPLCRRLNGGLVAVGQLYSLLQVALILILAHTRPFGGPIHFSTADDAGEHLMAGRVRQGAANRWTYASDLTPRVMAWAIRYR